MDVDVNVDDEDEGGGVNRDGANETVFLEYAGAECRC